MEDIKENNSDLSSFLNNNTDIVSPQEQKEFDAMNIDFNNFEGEELTVKEIINN